MDDQSFRLQGQLEFQKSNTNIAYFTEWLLSTGRNQVSQVRSTVRNLNQIFWSTVTTLKDELSLYRPEKPEELFFQMFSFNHFLVV